MGSWGLFLSLLVVALGPACGLGAETKSYDQSQTAAGMLADADLATYAAHSFHVSIDESAESDRPGTYVPATFVMDVEDANAGGMLNSGSIVVQVEHVNDRTFMFGTGLSDLIQSTNPQLASAIRAKASGNWVLVPNDVWTSSWAKLLDMRNMSSCLTRATAVAKKGTATLSGQSAVELNDKAGRKIYVQMAEPHHFLRVVLPASDTCATDSTAKGQTIDLSRYGARFHIAAPPAYVDLATLAGGG